jgi:hypothetical protein
MDVGSLSAQFPKQVNPEALATLLGCIITPQSDESIWNAVYGLFELPSTPEREPDPSSMEQDAFQQRSVRTLNDLQKDWFGEYFPDSLVALQQLVEDYTRTAKMGDYYSRSLVFAQSSGLGKSRLAEMFGTTCPMINFILREDGSRGFPPADSEIRKFVRMEMSDDDRCVMSTPSRKHGRVNDTVATIWNHSIAVGLLQASFEKCKFVLFLA